MQEKLIKEGGEFEQKELNDEADKTVEETIKAQPSLVDQLLMAEELKKKPPMLKGESLIRIKTKSTTQSLLEKEDPYNNKDSINTEERSAPEASNDPQILMLPAISTKTGSRKKPIWERGSTIEYPISPKAGR